jgi:hypothetical protein
MSRVQRSVLVTYCLSLAYCCVWVPWSVTSSDRYGTDHQRLGYGWVWAGPQYPSSLAKINPPRHAERPSETPDFPDVDEFVADQAQQHQWDAMSRYAVPDTMLMVLRAISLTLVSAAAFLLTGIRRTNHSVANCQSKG